MRYNQKRHLELRKCSQNLKNIGKSLYKEKEKDFLELCRYEGAIQEHIYWKNRRQFALLMESFFNKRIDGEELSEDFSALSGQLDNRYNEFISELGSEKLKDFHPDLRSTDFGNFISFLRAECDNFSEDYDNKEFYDSIKDCFLRFQKILNKQLDNYYSSYKTF
jgi:hypothetical protein